LLGALTTGLSAAVTGKQISIITAIFGRYLCRSHPLFAHVEMVQVD
jgi:hypothetical protein